MTFGKKNRDWTNFTAKISKNHPIWSRSWLIPLVSFWWSAPTYIVSVKCQMSNTVQCRNVALWHYLLSGVPEFKSNAQGQLVILNQICQNYMMWCGQNLFEIQLQRKCQNIAKRHFWQLEPSVTIFMFSDRLKARVQKKRKVKNFPITAWKLIFM